VARRVVRRGRRASSTHRLPVLDQTEQVQPAGGDGLAEFVVRESIELPENDVALLVEKDRENLPFAADSLSGHRNRYQTPVPIEPGPGDGG
jgi:hypothetical protein